MKTKIALVNGIVGIIGKIFTIVFAILVPKLIITYYGSAYNGLISSISGILIYLNLLEAGVGGASVQALYSKIAQKNYKKINGIISATSKYYKRTGVYYFACVSVIAFLYPFILKNQLSYFNVVFIILLSACPSLISYFFQGKYNVLITADNKIYIATIFSTILNIITNIAKIILIMTGKNIISIFVAAAIISTINALIFIVYIKKRYSQLDTSVTPDFEEISTKNDVLVFQIINLIIKNTDILILTFFCNLGVVSVYAIYQMIVSQLLVIPQIFSSSIEAGMGQLYYENKDKFTRVYNFFETGYIMITYILLTSAYNLMLPFIKLYTSGVTDANYIDKWLPLLFVLIPLQECIRTPSVNTLYLSGKNKELKNYAIVEAVFNLLLSIILVNYMGIYGVLIATFLSMFYFTFKSIIYVSQNILHRSYLVPLKRFLTCSITALIIVYFYSTINFQIQNYLEFFIVGSLVLLVTSVIYFFVIGLTEKQVRVMIFEYSSVILRKLRKYINRT